MHIFHLVENNKTGKLVKAYSTMEKAFNHVQKNFPKYRVELLITQY